MRKNGRDRYGRQRWQCPYCKLTSRFRDGGTQARVAELHAFLTWLLNQKNEGKPAQAGAFQRRVVSCLGLQPLIIPDGKPHTIVMADGTYMGRSHCLFTVCDWFHGQRALLAVV